MRLIIVLNQALFDDMEDFWLMFPLHISDLNFLPYELNKWV